MMGLNPRQLENIGFRFVLDELAPCSPFGREALKKLQPYGAAQSEALERELDNLERAIALRRADPTGTARVERLFMRAKDIRPSLRCCGEGKALEDVELFEIKSFAILLSELAPALEALNRQAGFEGLDLKPADKVLELLDPEETRTASFHISSRYSPALAQIRCEKRELEREIRTAAREERDALLGRRQALAAREREEEAQVCAYLSRELAPHAQALLHNCDVIARLDLLLQKAALAIHYGGCRPQTGAGELAFSEMTNPMLDKALREDNRYFVPVSFSAAVGAAVITGANMGGKSVVLKTLALNTLLGLCGFFPFAAEAALPRFEAIYLVSEDLEAADRGLSSFGGEILRIKEISARLDGELSLLLLDEFARGTNPREGAAIAEALTGWLQERRAVSVLTTHFDHVAQAAGAHWQVRGLKDVDWAALRQEIQGREERLGVAAIAEHMDYGLFRVSATEKAPHDALDICRLLGLPEEIVEAAEKNV